MGRTTLFSDSSSYGLDELFEWLNAIAGATREGPVLLVFTFADKVSREVESSVTIMSHVFYIRVAAQDDWRCISEYIAQELMRCEHSLAPGGGRLVTPDNGLIFYPVDNTKSEADRGIQAYKAKLKELCEASPSVTMPVPYHLIQLQDKLTSLAKAPKELETAAIQQLRRRYGQASSELSALRYIFWHDVQALYREGLDVGDTYVEQDLEVLVDFMDLQGVLMHNNAKSLRDLVILDQAWLMKQLTMIIRDPRLHNKEVDERMGPVNHSELYNHGELKL